jgi:PAS domain S-box-containing protein
VTERYRIVLCGVAPEDAAALRDALESAGLSVTVAPEARHVFARTEPADPPALILAGSSVSHADLARLVVYGHENLTAPCRVMALLRSDDESELQAVTAAGVDDWLRPPWKPNVAVHRVYLCISATAVMTEVERHRRDAAALLELSQTLSSSLEAPLILHAASRLMAQVIDVERCAIVMLDNTRNEGRLVAVSEDQNVRDLRINLDRYPEIKRVIELGTPLVVQDAAEDPLLASVRAKNVPGLIAGTAMLFPILMEGRVSGVFFLRSRQVRRGPDAREMQFGQTVANATSIALRNARIFEGQRASTERISRERERAEERLRALQDYEAFFEDAADGMVILDADGTVLYINREGTQQFGRERQDVIHRRFSEFLMPQSEELLDTILAEVMRGHFRKTFDLYAPRREGARCLSCSAGAVGEPGSAPRMCMISFRDVTALREMQTELRTTKEFLENLIDSSVDAIIAADTRGNVILFNKGAESVYGYGADEVIGKLNVAKLYPPGMAQEIMSQLRSNAYGGRGKLQAMRKLIRTKNHEDVPVSLTASVIYEAGQEVASVGIFTDLRDRLKIEKKLSMAQERLVETERASMAAQLAGATAHELNQPLTSVLGYAELMRRKIPEDSPLRRSVDIIFKEGERMAEIVRKIGRITKYETKPYVGSTMIVDIDRASTRPGPQEPAADAPASADPKR